MSSGMNVEQAKEYAKTMTYKQAVYNCFHAKGIMFRKATLIKLHELAEIADRLDKSSESQTESLLEARDLVTVWKQKHDELFGRTNTPQNEGGK